VRAELERDLALWSPPAAMPFGDDLRGEDDGLGRVADRELRDVRGIGIAGLLGDLVAAGAPVLAVTAHAGQRATALRDRVGGFSVTTWAALESDPEIAAGHTHVVAVDPPPHAHLRALTERLPGNGWTHLAWGAPELDLVRRVLTWELDLRPHLADTYRALRSLPTAPGGEALCDLLRGSGRWPRSGAVGGRVLRVLDELGLVVFERAEFEIAVPPPAGRTELERSPAFRAYAERLRRGLAYLAEPSRTSPQEAPEVAAA
jgi:hypothetical protein